jgi:hypothetical protein
MYEMRWAYSTHGDKENMSERGRRQLAHLDVIGRIFKWALTTRRAGVDVHVPYALRRALPNVVTKFWVPYRVRKLLMSTKLLAYQGLCSMECLVNKRC